MDTEIWKKKNMIQRKRYFVKLYEAKVREGIARLAKEDARLIYLLFFEEVTIKDAAQIMGCSRKTIYNRRKRILSELRSILHDLGIVGGAF